MSASPFHALGDPSEDVTTPPATAPAATEEKPMWPWIVGGILAVTGAIFIGTLSIDGSKTVSRPSPKHARPSSKEALA